MNDKKIFGGKLLAWHWAQSGRKTAALERRSIGGSVIASRLVLRLERVPCLPQ
jgi:hypothetical protein